MSGETPSEQSTGTTAVGRRRPLHMAAAGTIIAILALVVLAADQFAKYLVIQNLTPGEPVQILGDFLVFVLVFNPGAAFSLGSGVTWVFTIALAVVACGIVYLITRVRSRRWAVVLGLLLGGVLGNLTDRLFRDPGFPVGHVVDFISTPWMMPAIYNVADIFIVCDMIAVALLVVLGIRFDGSRERAAKGSEASASTSDTDEDESTDAAGPVSVEGNGLDRDPLFPTADPEVGAPLGRTADVPPASPDDTPKA